MSILSQHHKYGGFPLWQSAFFCVFPNKSFFEEGVLGVAQVAPYTFAHHSRPTVPPESFLSEYRRA